MLDEPLLMELLPASDQGGANGDTAAAPDVARQVDQARGIAGFCFRDEGKRHGVDGHEQERQPQALHHARADGVSEIDLRVPMRHLEQTQRGNDQADDNQPARFNLWKAECRRWAS